jgi:hypothetical protein
MHITKHKPLPSGFHRSDGPAGGTQTQESNMKFRILFLVPSLAILGLAMLGLSVSCLEPQRGDFLLHAPPDSGPQPPPNPRPLADPDYRPE